MKILESSKEKENFILEITSTFNILWREDMHFDAITRYAFILNIAIA